jgi:TatA/E family protein of Tat protein translocase
MGAISPLHLLIVLVVALVVIGPRKLPETGAALGKALREFREATRDISESTGIAQATAVAQPAEVAAAPAVAVAQPVIAAEPVAVAEPAPVAPAAPIAAEPAITEPTLEA